MSDVRPLVTSLHKVVRGVEWTPNCRPVYMYKITLLTNISICLIEEYFYKDSMMYANLVEGQSLMNYLATHDFSSCELDKVQQINTEPILNILYHNYAVTFQPRISFVQTGRKGFFFIVYHIAFWNDYEH